MRSGEGTLSASRTPGPRGAATGDRVFFRRACKSVHLRGDFQRLCNRDFAQSWDLCRQHSPSGNPAAIGLSRQQSHPLQCKIDVHATWVGRWTDGAAYAVLS
jgi:hypothetical protein